MEDHLTIQNIQNSVNLQKILISLRLTLRLVNEQKINKYVYHIILVMVKKWNVHMTNLKAMLAA